MLKCLTFRPYLDVEPICRPRYMRGAIIIWNVPPMSWAPAFSLGVVVILTNHCCHLPRQVHTMLFHTQAPKNVNVTYVALYKGVGSNENWYAVVHKSHITVKFVDIMGFPAIHLLIVSLIRQWPYKDLVIKRWDWVPWTLRWGGHEKDPMRLPISLKGHWWHSHINRVNGQLPPSVSFRWLFNACSRNLMSNWWNVFYSKVGKESHEELVGWHLNNKGKS